MSTLWTHARRIVPIVAATVFVLSFATGATAAGGDAATSRALVNQARAATGLAALTADGRLDAIAAAHAQRMADRDGIFHNSSLQAEADAGGVNWRWIGENVGVGPDVAAVHQGFMASPQHHGNIVFTNYDVIGTGAAVGKDGSVFIAQVFVGSNAAPTAAAAPKPAETQTVSPPAPSSEPTAPTVSAVPTGGTASQEIAPIAAPEEEENVNILFGGVINRESFLGP